VSFRDPDALWLLLLVPVFAGLAVASWWRRQRALSRFASSGESLAALGVGRSATGLRATQTVLVLLGLACLAVAYAGPRYGSRTRVLRRRGVDVVVAVDFSKSMLARDVPPSRIERAKAELVRFLDDLGGDRVGIVAFAGETMEFPMTDDYAAGALFLRDLGPYDMPVGGTAIGRALVAAKRLLARSRRTGSPDGVEPPPETDAPAARAEQVVILLTDGEDHEGDPVEAARDLANAGIRVFPVGIGSAEGEPIPTYSDDGTWTGYLRDRDGDVVKTALTPEAEAVLAEVAEITGGEYVRAEAGGVGMGQVRAAMRRMKQAERRSRRVTVHEDRSAFALLPGLLFLLAASLLPDSWTGRRRTGRRRPPRRPSRASPTSAAALALLATVAAGAAPGGATPASAWDPFRRPHPDVEAGNEALRGGDPATALARYEEAAGDLPGEPGLALDRGLALLAQGDLSGATDALRIASSPDVDPEIRADAAHDLGVAFLRQGDALDGEAGPAEAKAAYEQAVEAFRTSLRVRPGHRDTAWNLELALRKLDRARQQEREAEEAREDEEEQEQEEPPSEDEADEESADEDDAEPQEQDGEDPPEDGSSDTPPPEQPPEDPSSPEDAEEGEPGDPEEPDPRDGSDAGDDPSDAEPAEDSSPEPTDEADGEPERALPRDVESVLDALQEDEESLERARARGRRGRRTPPAKDW